MIVIKVKQLGKCAKFGRTRSIAGATIKRFIPLFGCANIIITTVKFTRTLIGNLVLSLRE